MPAQTYQKPRLMPDPQSFLEDLTTLRAMVAELTARYSGMEETTRAADAAIVTSPQSVIRLVADIAQNDREELRVLLLNTKNRVIDVLKIYQGTANSSQVRVAEVFRPAVVANAVGIVVVHNHPSGDTTPSPQDVSVTAELVKAGKILDIEVLDHLIIGAAPVGTTPPYCSLRERGLGF